MSRPNMNQGMMPNGIPPQWCGTQPPYPVPAAQKHMTPHVLNNGLGSSQSSRDSSPMSRIPASQLPPSRGHIPASQLPPPGRPGVSPILGTNGQISASATRVSTFSTSTPNPPPSINTNGKRSDIHSGVSGEIVQVNSVNSSAAVSDIVNSNKPTAPIGSYSVVPQQQQQAAPMNMRAPGTAPPQGMPPATNLVGQQNTLAHAASTPALSHQNMPPVKHSLNQPQNIPRPLSSGPQLQQNLPPQPLLGQSQFSQSQSQLAGLVSQPGVNPMAVSNANYQHQKPALSGLYDVNQQLKTQLPPQQFNNLPTSAAPAQTVAPPMTSSATMSPVALENNRVLTNYSSQNVVRPPMQNMNVYNSNATTNIPPKGPPGPIGPSASQYPTTPVSSIHSKRYPQPQYQNSANPTQQPLQQSVQQPNIYQPNSNVQSGQHQNAYNQQQTNTYYQQQQPQPNMGYQQPQPNQQRNYQQNLNQQMSNLSVAKSGFNKLWGRDNFDLLQCPNILPREQIEAPSVSLGQEFLDSANCSPEIFRCTMTKIPESNSLLQKSRLPLGVLIHPFKDLNHLPVIQCSTIVRCRACRTYINPFIFFVDTKRWKCNLCYRVNELPEEFQYDPVSKSYGDPSRRPEIKSSTIEYIAPSEYMLRPPQPAVYLFLLDISRLAVESGYLHTVCDVLSSQLATLPGDARTQIGVLAYNSTLHFYSLAEGLSQPHEMIVSDIDDVYLPCPDNLLVNLKEHMELVTDLLTQLPTRYQNSFDNGSALGAALQAAFKLMSSTGGRVTVFQTSLPTLGPGALTVREDPNQRAGKEAPHLNPATDFYKRLALDCSGHQVAVDLFVLNSQYVDVATLSGISRFSGGCMFHFPLFKASRTLQSESLERCFRRYLTRKIGFEAVMRIRCTRGLAIHTFHGNFFVRSTDLLSLPNVNPDAGFGMQVSIEESLADLQSVCFQAALLYTSSKGERRIRVHTLCLPIVTTLPDVLNAADQQCIVGLLSKMAVDRSLQSSLSDARDAFINVAIDILSSYKMSLNMGTSGSGLLAPESLKLLPLYILALLKYTAFRTGQSTRLDDRVFAMCDMKTLPLAQLLQQVYPDFYPIYNLSECASVVDTEGAVIPQPPRLQLTARNIDSHGAYLLDAGQQMIIYVCPNVSPTFLTHTLGVPSYNSITDQCYELPKFEHPDNLRLHAFINSLNDEKAYVASLQIIRENSPNRTLLLERLIEDRIESALSYNEFLQHLKTQVK